MYKFLLLTIIWAFLAFSSFAQKGTVKGVIIDSTNKLSIAESVVTIVNQKDSSSAGFMMLAENGKFEIKDLDTGAYKLIIAVNGLQEQGRLFKITTNNLFKDFGNVYVNDLFNDPNVLVVTSQEAPIKISGDSISFKADAFKTKPNASVEDLLKKLPGVEVAKDGGIKALGETVQKVYVDGKEFFGSDPKLATKNLQADMVDKVEIFDDMSDQAKFSKIDDGSRTKAINIKLKKDKKKGLFGKLSVGLGDKNTYDNSGNINYFKGDLKLSYIGQFNNVNKQGFSLQDIMGLSGGGMQMGGGRGGDGGGGMAGGASMTSSRGSGNTMFGVGAGASGISKSVASGFNFVNKLSKKVDLSVNYFFNNATTNNVTNRFTQQFFPNDSITEATSFSNSNNGNGNHRINARLEWAIDSVSSLLVIPNITFQNGDGLGFDSANTLTNKLATKYVVNKSSSNSTNINNAIRANNSVLYRRKLAKAGRTLQIGLQYNVNNSDRTSQYNAPFTTFKPDGSTLYSFAQNQISDNDNRGTTYGLNVSYTEPVAKNMLLEINGSHNTTVSNADRETRDIVTNNIIPQLTNLFDNTYDYNRLGANLRKQTKKYNYQIGMAVQQANLTSLNRSIINSPKLKNDFINIFPTARLTYNFTKSKNLRFDYRGRTNAPTINQLQDVPDVSNPLNVSTGNPNLGQEFNHNVSVNYTKFNMFTFKFIALVLNGGFTDNKISNSTNFLNPTLQNGRQITKPVNLDGNGNATAFIAYGTPVKGVKGLNLNLNAGLIYNRDVSLLFAAKNKTDLFVSTQTIGANYNYKSKLDLGFNAVYTYNMFKNQLQAKSNTNFLNQVYSLDATYSFKSGLTLASDVDYYNQGGVSDNLNSKFTLLNASIAKTVLKKKNGEIKLYVYDILNQNNSVSRSTAANSIIDTRNLVLNRYLMLSFTYNFSRFGGKPGGMGMMPRQFSKGMKDIRMN